MLGFVDLISQQIRPHFMRTIEKETYKISAQIPFDLTSNKQEVLELSLGKGDKSNLQHESLEVVSSFPYSDHEKYKNEIRPCQQPDRNISETRKLINFPEDDESTNSTFRKRYVF